MKKQTKRVNLVLDYELYNQILKNAESAHLKVGTYTRLVVIEALKNNILIKLNTNVSRIR
jgi:hypothetical protein